MAQKCSLPREAAAQTGPKEGRGRQRPRYKDTKKARDTKKKDPETKDPGF